MRKSFLFILVALVFSLFISACGGSGSSGGSNGVNGDYELTATSSSTTNQYFVGGPLTTDSNGNVNGSVHVLNQSCFNVSTALTVSGTATNGALNLTATDPSGNALKFTGTVHTDGSLAGGAFTSSGGSCNGDSGSVVGYVTDPFAGTYTGTLTSAVNSAITINLTAPWTQTTAADSSGLFHISNTITATGSCFTSAAVLSSEVFGSVIFLSLTGNDGSLITISAVATDFQAKQITVNYTIFGGETCSGDSGSGTVSNS